MNLVKVLSELREELANLDAAILSLEQLQQVNGSHRRGRPPKFLAEMRKGALPKSHQPSGQPRAPGDT